MAAGSETREAVVQGIATPELADSGMVIIGAGEAGVRAAATLRLAGYEGPVTLIGAEADEPYERPPLSKAFLTASYAVPTTISSLQSCTNVNVRAGVSAEFIAPDQRTVTLTSGEVIGYGKLLLATGARARMLSLPQAPETAILTLRTLADAKRIQQCMAPGRRVVIVGGGFVGLELAASLTALGATVHVVEPRERILKRAVPEPVAEVIAAEHARRGVSICLGSGIREIGVQPGQTVVKLDSGAELPADLIIVGIGAQPNTGLAETAGLDVDNGIAVNDRLRSSDPHIFAAGDCVSFPHALYGGARLRLESWRCAQEQGEVAARNMMGSDDAYAKAPWFWSDQFDLGLQIVGLAEFASQTVVRELGERARLLFHLSDTGQLIAASGIAPGNAVARDIRICEMLIERRAVLDPSLLADPAVKLKPFLKQ